MRYKYPILFITAFLDRYPFNCMKRRTPKAMYAVSANAPNPTEAETDFLTIGRQGSAIFRMS